MQTHLRGVLLQPLVLIMSAGYPDCARSAPHRSDWVDSRLPRTIKITTECPALVNKFQMRHERSSMHAPHGDVEMYRVWEYVHLSVLRGKVHFLWSISYYRRFYPMLWYHHTNYAKGAATTTGGDNLREAAVSPLCSLEMSTPAAT